MYVNKNWSKYGIVWREYLMFNYDFMQNNQCFMGFPAHPQQWL